MDYSSTIRSCKPGVEIFIGRKEQRFDLLVNILPGTDISKKIEGDGFTLKLTYADGSDKVKEFLHFEKMKKRCKWEKGKLVDTVYIISTAEYKLSLILSPKLYAPRTEAMKREEGKKRRLWEKRNCSNSKSKKTQRTKKKKGENLSYRGSRAFGFRQRTTTCYTHNNLYSPYQGGRCSPK